MAKPRPLRQPKGWAFGFCVVIVEPLLLLLTKRRWKGGENIPETGGCVVAVNHVSHLDPLTFAHFLYAWGRIVRFLAKAEMFEVPFVGRIVKSAKQIPVYRLTTDASLSFTAAVASVQEGECVVVYPEGTITREPRPVADDRPHRGGPHRAGLRGAGDPGRPVGCQPHPGALRQAAAAAAAQDDPRDRRPAGGPRRPAREAVDP